MHSKNKQITEHGRVSRLRRLAIRQQPHVSPLRDIAAAGGLVGWRQIAPLVSISRSTCWRRIQAGEFPAPFQISPGRKAWRAQDILDWLHARRPNPYDGRDR